MERLFPKHKFNIYKELYADLPETTIAEKVVKLRHIHNLERKGLSQLLDLNIDTIEAWEQHNVLPKPDNILKLCELFKVPIDYFGEYYVIYFDTPGARIKKWKAENNLTYKKAIEKLGISYSCFARLANGKIQLSYEMYLKLKIQGVFYYVKTQ